MTERSLGAVLEKSGVTFTVWAPKIETVEVFFEGGIYPKILKKTKDGYHKLFVKNVKEGQLYWYRLNGGAKFPDPCSLYQPQGPLGPSQVIDHRKYEWKDLTWKGVKPQGQIFYELHVGVFSQEGTFNSAISKLKDLKKLGITSLEVMPVVEAAGRWGWGYDGVDIFAPNHNFGKYNDFKNFVDKAHQIGLAVILDVVYNHLGPEGNFLSVYCKEYFAQKHSTDWGQALNYYGDKYSPYVREFFIQNAAYWISDFHLDGLRFDATQSIYDISKRHVLADISERCRKVSTGRKIFLVAENNDNNVNLLSPVSKGGCGMDAVWSDDFHHAAKVAMRGFSDGYLSDYHGSSQEFISAYKNGYLFQGQYSPWAKRFIGKPVDKSIAASSFVFFLQNHDQIANSITGERIFKPENAARYRLLAALLFFAPQTPLLFMGQEFGSSSPFVFFADHKEKLAQPIRNGVRRLISQFDSFRSRLNEIPDPLNPASFFMCKLIFEKRTANKQVLLFHRELIRLRRTDPVIASQSRHGIEGAQLNEDCFFIRYSKTLRQQRLLVVNKSLRKVNCCITDPIIVLEGNNLRWRLLWRSDAARYGGKEERISYEKQWEIPAECAFLLEAVPKK